MEARHHRDRIDHLEEENHRLNLIIRDKTVDDKLQAGKPGMTLQKLRIQCHHLENVVHILYSNFGAK